MWRYVDGETVKNLETKDGELKNWLNLAFESNAVDDFFSNAVADKKKTPATGKDSKKKSSKKKSSKKKTSTHLKPRKPIRKEKGVLAFPED